MSHSVRFQSFSRDISSQCPIKKLIFFFSIAPGLSSSLYHFATTARRRRRKRRRRTTTAAETTVTKAATTTTMEKTKFCSMSKQQLVEKKVETFRRQIKKHKYIEIRNNKNNKNDIKGKKI